MGATFILRTDKSEGYATLYARIQNRVPKINIRVSTGLEVDIRSEEHTSELQSRE